MKLIDAGYKYTPVYPENSPLSKAQMIEAGIEADLWAVEITDGKFKGLKFLYDHWELIKTGKTGIDQEGKRALNFKYNILPESEIDEPTNDADRLEMKSLMGNILLSILVEVARIEWPKKESKD